MEFSPQQVAVRKGLHVDFGAFGGTLLVTRAAKSIIIVR